MGPSAGGTSVFGGAFALTIDNVLGLVTILDSLLGPAPPVTGVTGNGVLASIVFKALSPGTSAIGLSNLILEDSLGAPPDAAPLDGLVQVGPRAVPEPTTLSLLGLGVCVALRRQIGSRGHGSAGR